MTDIITAILLLIGGLFMLLGTVGILRVPDLFTRMQAATKTSTLGASSMFLAVAVYFGSLGIVTRALLVIVFLFLTLPVSAHMIARAAYFSRVPLWRGTIIDDLEGAYNRRTHELADVTSRTEPHELDARESTPVKPASD